MLKAALAGGDRAVEIDGYAGAQASAGCVIAHKESTLPKVLVGLTGRQEAHRMGSP
jgi:hypothetical protein